MYPSGTGSSFNILIEDCSLNFFSSGVIVLSSSNNIWDIGLVALLFNDPPRLGSPGTLVNGCLSGSNTIPLPSVPVDVGSRDISTGDPGSIG